MHMMKYYININPYVNKGQESYWRFIVAYLRLENASSLVTFTAPTYIDSYKKSYRILIDNMNMVILFWMTLQMCGCFFPELVCINLSYKFIFIKLTTLTRFTTLIDYTHMQHHLTKIKHKKALLYNYFIESQIGNSSTQRVLTCPASHLHKA